MGGEVWTVSWVSQNETDQLYKAKIFPSGQGRCIVLSSEACLGSSEQRCFVFIYISIIIYHYFCQVPAAFFCPFLIFRFPHDLLTKTRFRRAGQNLGRGAKNPHCAFVGRRLCSDLSYCHPRPLCWNVLKIATDARARSLCANHQNAIIFVTRMRSSFCRDCFQDAQASLGPNTKSIHVEDAHFHPVFFFSFEKRAPTTIPSRQIDDPRFQPLKRQALEGNLEVSEKVARCKRPMDSDGTARFGHWFCVAT